MAADSSASRRRLRTGAEQARFRGWVQQAGCRDVTAVGRVPRSGPGGVVAAGPSAAAPALRRYNLPGALAHRNAIYDLAGGDQRRGGAYRFPRLLLGATLAVLRGDTSYDIVPAAQGSLQILSTKARVQIGLETTAFGKTLRP